MTYKSGPERTIREIKKELNPFVDMHKKLKRFSKGQERINKKKKQLEQYNKHQREIRLQKWENRINWLTDKINEHKKKKSFESNQISNTTFKSNNQNKEFSHEKEKLLDKTKIDVKKDIKKYSNEEIVEEINNVIEIINTNYNDVINYIQNRLNNFDHIDYSVFTGTSNVLFGRIEEVEKDLKRDQSKEQTIESYRAIIKIYKRSCELNESVLNKEKEEKIESKKEIRAQSNDRIEKDNYIVDCDQDVESNHDVIYEELEDWQKEEVDEGNYDSYNFEEEDLEEDDYYYEDDK